MSSKASDHSCRRAARVGLGATTALVVATVGFSAAGQAAPPAASTEVAAVVVTARSPNAVLRTRDQLMDKARAEAILPPLGATTYDIDKAALDALPQGPNTPLDKVLLQTPGVSYDSAISNPSFHVRNEYANVQYRINGVQLPDGVSALGPILETGFIGDLDLLDGVLPAQYGLRTAGVVDIAAKSRFDPGGTLDLYGGSLGTLSPSLEVSGASGQSNYFLTGRYLQSDEGLESATPTASPIHDRTTQARFFGYGSTLFGDSSRLTYMAGGFVGHFQIPDVADQAPLGDYGPAILSSTRLNENETDRFFFGVLALQTHHGAVDTQVSEFARYADTHFTPDIFDDLVFNDLASNVRRKSFLSGLQFDAADRLSAVNVVRAGLTFSVEQTNMDDLSTVLPLSSSGSPLPTPVTINDATSRLAWTAGAYLQDEWTILPNLTLNTGARFDQMRQFVAAGQLSPRIALIYKPVADTTFHAGVSRYFTPPMQAQATPNTLALFQHTVQQPAIPVEDPVRPERATYVDVGVDQRLTPGLTVGLDAYYKRSTDTLDDGQFGQAAVLDQYNYARGYSQGLEVKAAYAKDGFRAYANLSAETTKGEEVVSNQYVIGSPVLLAYLADHYTYASDAQTITASFGASYRWSDWLASLDGLYGSGLRAGFANLQHSPGYTQWNAAIARKIDLWRERKPLTVRLSVINLFDASYILRSGSGIGEFAPQYGPRRGVYAELSQPF